MHILLTRPIEDCKELIIKFKSLGHNVSHLPVIKIESKKYQEENFNEYGGIIFTSSNAIKNLDIKKINKNIYTADGNVNNLKEIILQTFNLNVQRLLQHF